MQQLSSTERAVIEAINTAPMLDHVLTWSAVNTGTANLPGLDRQRHLLADAFAALPGTIAAHPAAPVLAIGADGRAHDLENGAHLVVQVRPDAPRRFLLTGHMDTVFAADHPFQTTHWIDDATLGGPGVADMKGGIAVILAAALAFEQSAAASAVGYDILINADEETGSLSSAPLIANLARGKFAALTYEPSALPDGTLAGARPGSGNYSVTITGKSAHAGRNPQDGRNALLAAADLALRLKALVRDGLTINPARIDGGSANNVVPDHAVLRFNVRPLGPADAAYFNDKFKLLMADIAKLHEVSVHVHGGMSRPPKPLDPPAKQLFALVRDCGAALGQMIGWQNSGGVCDGNNIAACGVPVVDTMGVRGGAIHSSDEYLIVTSLAERACLSTLVLHRLASGAAL